MRRREYNLSDDTIARVAERRGLIGIILCPHYLLGGGPLRRRQAADLEASVEALCTHIDHIHDVTKAFDHVGIDSDLDGFIKPALTGVGHLGHMAGRQAELRRRYGEADAERICSGNAVRILTGAWG